MSRRSRCERFGYGRTQCGSGGSATASRSSTYDVSSSKRGGRRSHSGSQGPTKEQLYNEAKQCNIEGRSKMDKAELKRALGH
ncbi:hypothetical protein [Streptomyces avidinii]|uniref:Rho termination factor-like protein n=1 Tax=Streptomyces avidinii TaxID=1895 RepID=A0ABS4LFP0_STRAV|nr:hypothetical protein [Streptomyces avidinii]GGZ05887.1 hypothetical protein GCM10010343_34620 [Streptomyces avidinii]